MEIEPISVLDNKVHSWYDSLQSQENLRHRMNIHK